MQVLSRVLMPAAAVTASPTVNPEPDTPLGSVTVPGGAGGAGIVAA